MQGFWASAASQLNQLSVTEFWLGFTVVAAIALFAFWRMYCWLHHARVLETVPTARIRSAPQGYIELNGHAKAMDGPVIVSPLSSTVCVWFRYKIEEQVRQYNGKGRFQTRWKLVKTQTSEEVFLLKDDTGECAIDPDDAKVIVDNKRSWFNRKVTPVRRYTEELILEGEPLYAIGLFKSVATVENQKIRQQVSMLLRQWKQDDPNLLLHRYDSDNDGSISPTEWQQAHSDATKAVHREIGQQSKTKQLSMLRASPYNNQPYILSTKPESFLISHYKRHALLALLAFTLFGSLAVWALNQRLGI